MSPSSSSCGMRGQATALKELFVLLATWTTVMYNTNTVAVPVYSGAPLLVCLKRPTSKDTKYMQHLCLVALPCSTRVVMHYSHDVKGTSSTDKASPVDPGTPLLACPQRSTSKDVEDGQHLCERPAFFGQHNACADDDYSCCVGLLGCCLPVSAYLCQIVLARTAVLIEGLILAVTVKPCMNKTVSTREQKHERYSCPAMLISWMALFWLLL